MKDFKSIKIEDFFLDEPDRCERLISALQFCSELSSDEVILSGDDLGSVSSLIIWCSSLESELSTHSQDISNRIYHLLLSLTQRLEKGLLYRNMIDLSNLQFAEQIPLVFSKFSEFSERCV